MLPRNKNGTVCIRHRLLVGEALMLADLPVMPLYFYVKARLVSHTVVNYRSNIMDHHYTRYLDKRPR